MTRISERSQPTTRFQIDEFVNYFYHITGLFPELFGPHALQRVNIDPRHLEKYGYMKTPRTVETVRALHRLGWIDCEPWDVQGLLGNRIRSERAAAGWKQLYDQTAPQFQEIWRGGLEKELAEYGERFSAAWEPISQEVLLNISKLAKRDWHSQALEVYFVHCLYGGSSRPDGIVIVPYDDFDVEKKLLAHELVHAL